MSFDNGLIDLRSDTVTHPTPAMRAAMARAEVGDDVYDEDPTVHQLQDRAAALTGHAAALFVPTGTMGNLIALLTHTRRGNEVIVGQQAHIFLNEAGGMAALGGLQACTVPNQPDGTLRLSDVEAAIREDDEHHPRTRLICLENTQNQCGGVPLTPAYTRAVADLAHTHHLAVHLDGARLFNAAVAQGCRAADLAAPVDSVMFCLSKGLCAPLGSVLCGAKDFIAEARRYRKQLGGGMRQVGVIAATGVIALNEQIERLDEDHRHARRLAEGLREVPAIRLEAERPPSNMVYFQLQPPHTSAALIAALRAQGILIGGESRRFRLVTHYWISADDVERVIQALRAALA
jgi:threonine aldolase